MNEREMIEKWISVFGKDLDKEMIEDLAVVGKVSAKEMDEAPESDVYLVAKDFS